MRSGGHPLARWPVAGAGTCPPCAGCCCAPWPAWPARWRGRTHRLPPQPHPQAAGHAPASSTHAGAGCAPRITGVHAARGEGVHILQRSQDEAPSAGPPTALPPSAGVPVTLPDRWINPGRWPGHDGEVWYRVDWRNRCAAAASPGVALATDSINMAGELWVGHTLLWRDRHLAEPLSRSWKDARVSVGMRSAGAHAAGGRRVAAAVSAWRHRIDGPPDACPGA